MVITVDPTTGKFAATLEGKTVTAPSLDAMMKKIDNREKSTFKPFTALMDVGRVSANRDRYIKVLIVGIKRSRAKSYRGEDYWVTSTGDSLRTVYADTPESLQRLKDRDAMYAQCEKEKDELSARHREQRARVDGLLVALRPPAK